MRRMVSTCLLTAAVTAAVTAIGGGTAHADDACPGFAVGNNRLAVCETFVASPTANTGYTVAGSVWYYCDFDFMTCAAIRPIPVGATGADVNGNTPPVPTYDPSTGQVYAPAGTYATVYVNGTAYPINTPAYCVTIDVRC